MTNSEFKQGLQSELKAEQFTEIITRVEELGVNTSISFNSGIKNNTRLLTWLQNRFAYGITLDTTNNFTVYVNTPNQNNKDQDFKKGDRKNFLDYEIIYCTNNDGIVLKHRSKSGYESHLGNYSTLDDAQKSAVVYFMIARPEEFATGIFFKVMGRGGTMHEYYKLKKVLQDEGIEMPSEITPINSMNMLIGYKNEKITFNK